MVAVVAVGNLVVSVAVGNLVVVPVDIVDTAGTDTCLVDNWVGNNRAVFVVLCV